MLAAYQLVLRTASHLPGPTTPDAECIVNPNQRGCDFPSKNLAGCGVIFYVMLALKNELTKRNWFATHPEFNVISLLDYVALGTVADVVKLDDNNRRLVSVGLDRMRKGLAHPGIKALLEVAARREEEANTFDMGFGVGPRLNAAGRLDDMSVGINCLLADDLESATALAQKLDALNRERRAIEADMTEQAVEQIEMILRRRSRLNVHHRLLPRVLGAVEEANVTGKLFYDGGRIRRHADVPNRVVGKQEVEVHDDGEVGVY